MKKFVFTLVALLALTAFVDAGPFRNLLDNIRDRRHGNSSCQPSTQATQSGCQSCAQGTCGPNGCAVQSCPNGVCEAPQGTQAVALVFARQLDAKTFAGAFQRQLTGKADTIEKRHLLNIVNAPDSPRRDRQLARMEHTVRGALGIGHNTQVDWSTINWPSIFQMILQLLISLLPLLGGL